MIIGMESPATVDSYNFQHFEVELEIQIEFDRK